MLNCLTCLQHGIDLIPHKSRAKSIEDISLIRIFSCFSKRMEREHYPSGISQELWSPMPNCIKLTWYD